MKQKTDWKAMAWEWIESIVIAFILAMLIRSFLIQPFKIPSGSMRMTLVEGDRLFVNKLAYGPLFPLTKFRLPGFTKPKRGDVIVFRYPVTKDKDFIKRLIAFGEEIIEVKEGKVLVNGQSIEDGAISKIHYYNRGEYTQEGMSIKVPKGHLFVMGDNSSSSHDSRYWGFVPEALVIGKAEFIFWPLKRIQWIR